MKFDTNPPPRQRAPIATSDCGMAMSAKLLGDKWTLLIMREVFYGVSCFGDIQADLGVPPATLQKRLAMLVDSGVLERVPYKVETERTREAYQLTEAGRALLPVILAMKEWGDNVLRDDDPLTRLVNKHTGERLRVGLVDANGQAVPLDQAELRAIRELNS